MLETNTEDLFDCQGTITEYHSKDSNDGVPVTIKVFMAPTFQALDLSGEIVGDFEAYTSWGFQKSLQGLIECGKVFAKIKKTPRSTAIVAKNGSMQRTFKEPLSALTGPEYYVGDVGSFGARVLAQSYMDRCDPGLPYSMLGRQMPWGRKPLRYARTAGLRGMAERPVVSLPGGGIVLLESGNMVVGRDGLVSYKSLGPCPGKLEWRHCFYKDGKPHKITTAWPSAQNG